MKHDKHTVAAEHTRKAQKRHRKLREAQREASKAQRQTDTPEPSEAITAAPTGTH